MTGYWDRRYQTGGRSGERRLAAAALHGRYRERASAVNRFAVDHDVDSVLDIGCGDGRQAAYLTVPGYLGVDPSIEAVRLAREHCPNRNIQPLDTRPPAVWPGPLDLHLSLSVIFHLTDDAAYHDHMTLLFSADRYAIVDATNFDHAGADHVRHRHWTPDVPDGWTRIGREGRMTFWQRT